MHSLWKFMGFERSESGNLSHEKLANHIQTAKNEIKNRTFYRWVNIEPACSKYMHEHIR